MAALSSTPPAGTSGRVATLRSLPCIRARCAVVLEAAKSDKLTHFRLDLSKLDDVATFVQGRRAGWAGSPLSRILWLAWDAVQLLSSTHAFRSADRGSVFSQSESCIG